MGTFKFILKLVLLVCVVVVAVGLYFYDKHRPTAIADAESTLVNDVTGLNPVNVARVVKPLSEQDIVDAINDSTGPISIGGARYSMGGQIAFPDSLHFDMRDFNQVVEFKPEQRLITVQSGMTWKQIQQVIDPHDLSVKVMQDFNNFTVGGSLSVNAHGRFIKTGTIINSVRQFRIVLANGKVYEASPDSNPALFYGAIGGYGALGVITHVTLELVDNINIERSITALDFHEFLAHFRSRILNDERVELHHALLYPPAYESLLDISWRRTDKALTEEGRLQPETATEIWRDIAIDMFSDSNLFKRLRKNLVDPLRYRKPAVVRRNWETSHDLEHFGFLSTEDQTLALRMYFVPINEFEIFVLKMRDIFIRTDASILNISVRYVPKDPGSLLAWAKDDMFSFSITYHQDKDPESLAHTRDWSTRLIEAAVTSGGSYYMPFKIHETNDQFLQAYPDAGHFFTLKEKADPANRFNNLLWLRHYAKNSRQHMEFRAALEAGEPLGGLQKVSDEVVSEPEAEPTGNEVSAPVDAAPESTPDTAVPETESTNELSNPPIDAAEADAEADSPNQTEPQE